MAQKRAVSPVDPDTKLTHLLHLGAQLHEDSRRTFRSSGSIRHNSVPCDAGLPNGLSWIAGVVWQDATTGQEVRAESGIEYATYAEALLASQELGQDTALRDQLEPHYPRTRYWRRRAPWLLPEEDRPT